LRESPPETPVRNYEGKGFKHNSKLEQATGPTLDIYCTKQDLVAHVGKITDPQTAWTLTWNAKLYSDLPETEAKELQKGYKL